MSLSLKQVITQAIIKVSATDPSLNREGGMSAEEARDSFIALLIAELFPEHGSEAAVVEVPVAAKSPVKLSKEEKAAAKAAKEAEKAAKAEAKAEAEAAKAEAKAAKEAAKAAKAASPKKSPEVKAAEKAAEKAAKEAEKAAAKEAEKVAKEAAKEAEKAAKEAAKAEAKAAKEAEKAAAKEAEKAAKAAAKEAEKALKAAAKVPLPASPAADVNLAKLDPTWRKALKDADAVHAKELEPALLAYLNGMSNAGYNNFGAKAHVKNFLAERAQPAEAPAAPAVEAVNLEVVEFQGKEYYVNTETKRVYEGVMNSDGELTHTNPVGYVGMLAFKDMTLEDE